MDGTRRWMRIVLFAGLASLLFWSSGEAATHAAIPGSVTFQQQNNDSPGAAIVGIATGLDGIGVIGLTSRTSGLALGVLGVTLSRDGFGVQGIANSTSISPAGVGFPVGVFGRASSPTGVGVRGTATSPDGITTGVVGENFAP